MTAAPKGGLTAWQLRILALVAEGLERDEVAARLHIAPNTVKSHLHRIYRQMNAHNAPHAVAIGYRLGLLKP